MLAQESAFPVLGMEGQAVKFVISEHGECGTAVDHGADYLQRLTDVRPTVDEVAHEDHGAVRMPIDASRLAVAELSEQGAQLGSVTVDVADDVVVLVRVCSHKVVSAWAGRSFGSISASGMSSPPRSGCPRKVPKGGAW